MTSTLCRSAVLGRILAPWLDKIADLFAVIVRTILGVFCREAGWPELSRLMMPKVETHGPARMLACPRLRCMRRVDCDICLSDARKDHRFRKDQGLQQRKAMKHSAAT